MSLPANPLTDRRRRRAEELVVEGERAWGAGNLPEARALFAEAAAIEEEVARGAPLSLSRPRTALAIAAVSLWYRASELARAKLVAYSFLAQTEGLTQQGRADLERLVDRCSREAEIHRLTTDSEMVPVEIKLEGGRVGVGVAPAAAVRRRRDAFEMLLMRAADLESALAYRDHGKSDLDRNDEIQLHEVPARAASYGVQFYVATGTQQQMATERRVTPKKVVERFLALAQAAEEGADAVRALVPDTRYANAFVAGFSEIAADGDDVGSVSCSTPTWRFRAPTVVLGAEHRRRLKAAVPDTVAAREPAKGEKILEGILTKVELKKGWNWATIDLGDNKEEVVLIEDKALRLKAAGLRASDEDVRVRAVVRRSEKKRRFVLIDVLPISKRG